jgi:preprotein translocase subunit SecD
MRLRTAVLIALAGAAVVGCGPTRTVVGEVGPQVTAVIALQPAPGAPLSKVETELATNVISARLKSVGIGTFSIAAGNDIKVSISGAFDLGTAQLLVQTPGVFDFRITLDANASPLPVGGTADNLAPFWDGDEVAAVSTGTDSAGHPAISIQLTDAGATAFATATAGHVGEQLTIALDRRVLAVQTIEQLSGGGTTLTFAAPDFISADALQAILLDGPLPPGWRQQ